MTEDKSRVCSGAAIIWRAFDPTRQLYFDQPFPWMAYVFQRERDGSVTMGVFNLFTGLFGGFPDHLKDDPKTDYDESKATLDGETAFMKVKNIDVPWSIWGLGLIDGKRGTLGMAFKVVRARPSGGRARAEANPFLAILEMLPPTEVAANDNEWELRRAA